MVNGEVVNTELVLQIEIGKKSQHFIILIDQSINGAGLVLIS